VRCLALAAGSILYVVIELIMICGREREEGSRACRSPTRGSSSGSARTSCSSPSAP